MDKRKKDQYMNGGSVGFDGIWNVAYEGGFNTRDNPGNQSDQADGTYPIKYPNDRDL